MADRPIEYAVHPATVHCSVCGQLRSGDPCGWCSNPFADVDGGPVESVQPPPFPAQSPGPPSASYRPRVYVAGPLGANDAGRPARVQAAVDAGLALMAAGVDQFVPHLWGLLAAGEADYARWMEWALNWLGRCDMVLRIPGDSPGADREVAEARRLGIPVFYSVDDVCPPGAAFRASPDSTDSEAAGRRKAVGTAPGGRSLDRPPCAAGCGCALCVERVTLACEKALATLPPDVAVSTWERLAPGKRP